MQPRQDSRREGPCQDVVPKASPLCSEDTDQTRASSGCHQCPQQTGGEPPACQEVRGLHEAVGGLQEENG